MPKRVVDGDAVWRSKKLKLMHPQFRAEYANLVPLAEANGVFEVDADRIWSDVYSYNRDEISVETVEEILANLEEVGLLRVWEEDRKVWGYWEGIHKSGRLPKASELSKYKNLPPNPPPEKSISGDSAETSLTLGPRFGIGLDRIGNGLDAEPQDQNETISEDEDTDMKLKKEIQVVCMRYGANAGGFNETWEQMSALEQAHSRGAVVRSFTEFLDENQGDDFPRGAVSAYLRGAARRLSSGTSSASVAAKDPQVKALEAELIYLSDDRVTFQAGHKIVLEELLREHSPEEVISAFKTFIENKDLNDPKVLNFAAKNFVDAANGLILSARRRNQERDRDSAARESAKLRLQEEAEAERAAAEVAKQAEEALFDPLA